MRTRRLVGVFIVMAFLVGCATTTPPMSLKGRAAMVLATYNSQTQNTVALSKRTDLTEEQKAMVRKKKAIIVKLDPMIKAYGTLVQSGGIPSPTDEQAIYSLIDELVGGQ